MHARLLAERIKSGSAPAIPLIQAGGHLWSRCCRAATAEPVETWIHRTNRALYRTRGGEIARSTPMPREMPSDLSLGSASCRWWNGRRSGEPGGLLEPAVDAVKSQSTLDTGPIHVSGARRLGSLGRRRPSHPSGQPATGGEVAQGPSPSHRLPPQAGDSVWSCNATRVDGSARAGPRA